MNQIWLNLIFGTNLVNNLNNNNIEVKQILALLYIASAQIVVSHLYLNLVVCIATCIQATYTQALLYSHFAFSHLYLSLVV